MVATKFRPDAGQRRKLRRISLSADRSGAHPRQRKTRAAASAPACLVGAILAGLLTLAPPQANAESTQPGQAFYHGKTVTVIIPYGAAGGYEYWAAALKPYLEKTLGVTRIDLVNKTGGGGLVGANYLYQANPDGLTIGEINGTGGIFAQIIKKPGVYFDMTKYDWIGSPNVETTVTVARAGDAYKSFGDLWKLRGGTNKVVGLSAGYGGNDYVGTAVPLSTFGIPYQMLLAYQGSSAAKAGLLRGDGDISTYGYSVFRPLIELHSVVPLYIAGAQPFASLPGTPTIVQLAQQYKLPQSQADTVDTMAHAINMGKDWAAPPGIPADRLAFLRAAFRAATENPGFLDAAKKAGRVGGYGSPADIEQTIASVIKNETKFTPFLKP